MKSGSAAGVPRAKVKYAQNAGAVAVVIDDDVAGSSPPPLGGADPTITIPAVSITQADGGLLREELHHRSRTRSGLVVSLDLDPSRFFGADAQTRSWAAIRSGIGIRARLPISGWSPRCL